MRTDDVKMIKNVRENVSSTLTELIFHFNQSIHCVREELPYFESSTKESPIQNSVLQHCYERICHLPRISLTEWIRGYKVAVHLLLIDEKSNAVSVIQNYEIILFKLFEASKETQKVEHNIHGVQETFDVEKTLSLIAWDMHRMSKPCDRFSTFIQYQILIPTMLRIITHICEYLSLISVYPQKDSLQAWVELCVSLLPFVKSRIDPPTILPMLSRKSTLEDWCPLNATLLPGDEDNALSSAMSLTHLDWTDVTLIYSVESLTFSRVWQSFANLVVASSSQDDENIHLIRDVERLRDTNVNASRVVHTLGINLVGEAVCLRFFGTEAADMLTQKPLHTSVFLGKRITKEQELLQDEKKYFANPTLLYVFFNFLLIQPEEEVMISKSLSTRLLSCCLELLDSTNATHVTLGACSLAHLTVLANAVKESWRNKHTNICNKLEEASRIHREGTAVAALGRAQYLIIHNLNIDGKLQGSLCRQWIANLHLVSSRASSESLWEILVGVIIPVLYSLSKLPEARGTEFGRSALSILLPLVRGELLAAKTRIAAIVALIILMSTAYPIMPHHGGKILCHLLSAVSDSASNNQSVSSVETLAMYSASLCLLCCGSSARKVLDDIDTNAAKYQKSFLNQVSQIRKLAVTLSS